MKNPSLFQAMFEEATQGIMVINASGEIRNANPFSEKIFGYNNGELNGQSLEILLPEFFQKIQLPHRKSDEPLLMSSAIGTNLEHLGQRKDGSQIPLEISLSFTNVKNEKLVIFYLKDITEVQKAQAHCQDNSRIIEDSLNEIFIFDATTFKFIRVNKGARQNLGYSIDEILQLTPIDIKPEHTKDSFLKLVQTLLNGEEKIIFETIHQRKDKTTYPVEVHLEYTTYIGQPVYVAYVQDITGREKAERFTEAILSSISSHIAVLNQEGVIINVNRAWINFAKNNSIGNERISSLGIGVNYLDVCKASIQHGDITAKESLEGIQAILSGKEKEFYHEYPCHSPTEKRWFSMRVKPLSHIEKGAVVVHLDITDRKLAEEELIHSFIETKSAKVELENLNIELEQKVKDRTQDLEDKKTRLIQAQKIAKVGSWDWNLQTDEVSWSEQILENFGLEKNKKLTVEDFYNLIHSDDKGRIMKLISELRKTPKPFNFRIITPKGKVKHLYGHGEIIKTDEQGNILMRGIIHDITELKEAEIALEKSRNELKTAFEKEQELGMLKSRFVSMASHEFRTPLSSILSSANIIGRYELTEQQEKRTKHVNRIESSVRNLTNILNDFLSLEKLESGKLRYEPESLDFNEYAKEVLEEINLSAKDHSQIIFSHSGNNKVSIDPQLVKNVLINLLSNAVKYSPNGEKVELFSKKLDEALEIYVKDHGIGIPETDQKNMFSRFFRATNVVNIQGTGLGLTIVKRYLDLMGGEIDFESEENKGTTFKVVIPQRKEE